MKPKVLLVEDDHSVAYMLTMALTQAGFEVCWECNGLEGWRAFQAERPDIVLSDIKMPEMDGMGLLSKIRAADPEMDVVILTGHGDLPTAIQAVELGAYRYLEKPINQITDLVDTLHKALERQRLRRERAFIDQVSRDLSLRLRLDDFLDRFLEHILATFPQVDAVFLSLYDAAEHKLIVQRVCGLPNSEELVGLRTTPTWRLGGRPPDAAEPVRLFAAELVDVGLQELTRQGVSPPLVELVRQQPNMGIVGIPIISKDYIIGGLTVVNFTNPELMGESLMALLNTLCHQVGLNMRNATLFADLQAQTGRLEAVLQSSPDGMVVVDTNGEVIMTNPRYRELFSPGGRLNSAAQQELLIMLKVCLQDEACTSFTFSLEHPTSDEPTVLEVSAAHVHLADQAIGIVANLRDVTLLHSRERQSSDMLRFARHEIGTPLAVIRAHVHNMLTRREKIDEEQRIETLQWIARQVKEVDRLVDETLSYSELKEALLVQKQAPLDLSGLAIELAQDSAVLASKDGHQFVHQIEPGLRVMGNQVTLKQAFRNLLDNARKFTPSGASISWRAWREGANVQLEVVDTGVGIPAEDQGRIFDMYFRGDENTAGTGLGLSIVKDVVSAHRGKITVESEVGKGSCFRVTLLALDEA